ncbi:MAG TPA: FAD-dependent oxidoreductase, partial [Candidatus Latescibacteria bacterium]|nr:FAD-dependent oxidoreductase [Candidatus Latescibacterota bacterium]
RSIACDHLSQASLRGAATCLATGQAAGVAAALAAEKERTVREVNIREVQKTLVQQGAVLGIGDRAKLFE